tara:strand:+ start:8086 stop:9180 length:1095 start_codon:yes stop_codon:yes gene_type:complete
MPRQGYTFLKEDVEVHVVYNGNQQRIDISEISFSQTFRESSYPVKTLQSQSSFEGSVINTANPANFSLNVPLTRETRNKIIFDRLLDTATFDLYISSQHDVYKLETCVIQSGNFQINRSRPLRLSVEGDASKLSKFVSDETNFTSSEMQNSLINRRVLLVGQGDVDFTTIGSVNNEVGTIFTASANIGSSTPTLRPALPGAMDAAGITLNNILTTTYNRGVIDTITIGGGIDLSSSVVSLNLELQNDITWNKNTTLQGALSATSGATSMFPTSFTVGTRILAGSIRVNYDPGAGNWGDWNSDSALDLKVGQTVGGVFYGIRVNLANVTFTNRFRPASVFQEEYNWRSIQNPTALSSVVSYFTNT